MADDAAAFQAVPNEELAFLGTKPVPTAPYYDPAYYELEREAVFRRSWLHVGRVSEIAEPRRRTSVGPGPPRVRHADLARAMCPLRIP